MSTREPDAAPGIPPCPRSLLVGVYVLYLGLATTASVPLFAEIDWLHEGERLGTAQIVLDGGLPFRDAFLVHGLFPDVVRPLLAFQLFGESLAADRLVGLLIEPLAYVAAVFYLWRVFPSTAWRIVGLVGFGLYPLLLIPRHIVVFLALGFLTSWGHVRRRRYLVLAGTMTGLAYVASSLEQATFLLGTVMAFPVFLAIKHSMLNRVPADSRRNDSISGKALYNQVVFPLLGGLLLGLIPFWGYLWLSGTTEAFLNDFTMRVLTDTVIMRDPYPAFTLMNITWYLVPALYVVSAVAIMFRIRVSGDQHWTPIMPTLLFGILSFIYAMRGCCPTYWKLATVSFPFIVLVTYVLYVMKTMQEGQAPPSGRRGLFRADQVLLTLTSVWMLSILLHSLIRDWGPKQVAPRILFPALALMILGAVGAVAYGWIRERRWRGGFVVACPLAALIVAVWFYNDAKPQVLSAQLKKPRLVSDMGRLADSVATANGRLTRMHPLYLQDEVLSYLTTSSHQERQVVILATGAGIYYFLASLSPPNRFPEVYHAMADGPAIEVVEGLERTRAEVLVACHDHGQSVTGWPMNDNLARFLAENYVDSGVRLNSKRLGAGCPFSVWVHRESQYAKPASNVSAIPALRRLDMTG